MDYVCNRCLFSIPSKIRFAFHFVERNQIITSDRSSHWTARSYSVATFGVKNHFKLWKELQRELTVRTIQRMNLKSWYTSLQQKPLNRCKQVQVPYKWPKTKIKPTNGLLKTSNRWIKTDQWPMTKLTPVLQPLPWRLYWPITFNGPEW